MRTLSAVGSQTEVNVRNILENEQGPFNLVVYGHMKEQRLTMTGTLRRLTV